MITVSVPLTGRLSSYGPRSGHHANGDGTYQVSIREGSRVAEVVNQMSVALVDRDAVPMWRMVVTWNKGWESDFDFQGPSAKTERKAA